jgi:rhombotail lipoprotein
MQIRKMSVRSKAKALIVLAAAGLVSAICGCAVIEHGFCVPACRTQTHNTSSLVSYLYPNGELPPSTNSIPELHVPLRIGLAFLPSQGPGGAASLDAAQKEQLLDRIRQRFASRSFVSEIVVIPDYYLGNNRGFAGLDGVQRLYNIDLMALVSYDQVRHTDDNKLSLGYLTIVGAYVLRGSTYDTATLVDLAVVDPATRSLVLRAGGTSTSHDKSTLVDVEQDSRKAAADGFNEATDQMINHFDAALTAFQADVRSGKANVRVIAREQPSGHGGGGSLGTVDVLGLLLLAGATAASRNYRRRRMPTERSPWL